MVDLVAARAAGVLSAFNRSLRVVPFFGGVSKIEVKSLRAAWLSGYDAEKEWQEHQMELPAVENIAVQPRSSTNGI